MPNNSQLEIIGKAVDNLLPDGHGFIVLTFPFAGVKKQPHCCYVSNANQDDALLAMQDFITKVKQG